MLLLLAVLVHILGRTAAVCHPYKADSFVYATAAHKLWHGGATFADLIPDKPPGQALLTGWCYRLAPEPHTRLTLIPIESAFLLAAYAVFWLVARRLCGPGAAAALTLFFAIAHNTYNALDFSTDGLNLNECYLALPMMLAVWAHLNVESPAKRGLLRGVAIGLALSVKQSAVGLLLALMVHGFAETCLGRRAKQGATSGAMTLLGLAAAWAPVVLFLYALPACSRMAGGPPPRPGRVHREPRHRPAHHPAPLVQRLPATARRLVAHSRGRRLPFGLPAPARQLYATVACQGRRCGVPSALADG